MRMTLSPGSVPPPGLKLGIDHPIPPQVFYWTHLSYLPLWLLLIMHGPNFWKRLLVPGILFFLEKAGGLAQTRMAPLHIVEVNLLPSKVQGGPFSSNPEWQVVGWSTGKFVRPQGNMWWYDCSPVAGGDT